VPWYYQPGLLDYGWRFRAPDAAVLGEHNRGRIMSSGHASQHAETARRIPLAAILVSLVLFAVTAASMAAGLAFLRSGANFRVDSAAFIAAAFFGVLAVGIPAILIRERRLAADERLSRELDLAGLSAVLTEVSETPPP
jgi:hypothetical protein